MAVRFETLKKIISVSVLSLLVGCATQPRQKSDPFSSHSPVGETYFDGNRAPASMSPPFDMGPEKITLDPIYMRTKADYHFALAESYSYEGDYQKAIEELKLTSVYDPKSPVVKFKLAVEYVKKGLVSEGMAQAEEAIKVDPNYTDARLLLGGIYSAIKLYDKAEEQYKYVIKENKQNREAHLYLGALYTEQKKYDEAIAVFSGLTKDAEFESPHLAHYYLARVHLEKKDDKSAEASFSKALSIKPEFIEGVLALGSFYESHKKRGSALKLYESFQDKHGPNERVADSLSRLYLEDEKYQKAREQLELVVAADPDNLNAKVKVALILIELKEYPAAIKRLKEILAQAPDSDKIRFFLGAVYEEVKDYKAAIEQFNMLEATSAYYPEAMIHASYLHKVMGDYDSAITMIEKAIDLRPETAQFYPLYASYLDDTRQYEKAVKMLELATIKFPTSDQLHFFLGSMHDKVGNKPQTVVNMKKTLEINPDHVQALNYLAYTYAEMNENLEEAYGLAKQALALKPDDAYIQDTVGWVYYKRGQYREAVQVLEAAYKVKSDESVIAEHLGDAYYKLKLIAKAKDMYKRAVKLETNAENVKKIEAKIGALEEKASRVPASLTTD